mmetsp:Transcript_33632/g.50155  ORF Transcript_33632/g.50155 Transcript_33632/m.50155 type:complete len:1010 (-) Transcript_33632:681-3710(-)
MFRRGTRLIKKEGPQSDRSDQDDEECQNSRREQEVRPSRKKSKSRAKNGGNSFTTPRRPCQEIIVEKSPSSSPNPQEHEHEEISQRSRSRPRSLPPPQSVSEACGLVVERHPGDLSDDCYTYSEDDDDILYADAVAAAAAALSGSKIVKKRHGSDVDATVDMNGSEVPSMVVHPILSNHVAFSSQSPSSSPCSSVTSSSSPRTKGRRRRRGRKQRGQSNHRLPSQLPSLVEVREDGLRTPTRKESPLHARHFKPIEEVRLSGAPVPNHFYYGAVSSSPRSIPSVTPSMSPKKRGLTDDEEEINNCHGADPAVDVATGKDFTEDKVNYLKFFSPDSTASSTTVLTSPPVSPSGRRGTRSSHQRLRDKIPPLRALRSSSGNSSVSNLLSPLSDSAELKSAAPSDGSEKDEMLRAGAAMYFWNDRRASRSSRRGVRRMEEQEVRKEQAIRALWGSNGSAPENGDDNEDATADDNESTVSANRKIYCCNPHSRCCFWRKDTIFAVLFVLQLIFVVFCAGWFGASALRPLGDVGEDETDENGDTNADEGTIDNPWKNLADDDFFISGAAFGGRNWNNKGTRVHIDYMTVIQLTCVTGTYACALSVLTIGFMMILAKSLIHVALIFAVIVSLAWCIVGGLMSEYSLVPFLGIIAFALCVGYVVVVWERVPFSATVLNTSLYGMRCTADIMSFGFFMTIVAFGWTVLWMLAFIGVYDYMNDTRNEQRFEGRGDGIFFFVFSLSYFWTFQVIKNIIQVTVAGTIGAWWFNPEQVSPCCSRVVNKSFVQSLTSSFGSICFGSLFVHPAHVISRLIIVFFPHLDRVPTPVLYLRRSRDGVESVASWESSEIDALNVDTRPRSERALQGFTSRLTGIFNHWAFTYIGLHDHDSFLDAGKKAMALFEIREWTHIVADGLIHNVLFLSCFVIGGSAGCFGLMVEEVDGYSFTSFNKPMITAFLIGSFIGFSLSNVFLNIVGSSVNTVLLCYAAAPFEFHQNHHLLSNEMKDSWNERWSDNFV